MGLIRFRRSDEATRLGYLVDGTVVDVSETFEGRSEVFSELNDIAETVSETTAKTVPRAEVDIRSPVTPSKIVRLDGCYEHDLTDEGFDPHIEDAGLDELSNPALWVAPPTTLTGTGSTVRVPEQVDIARVGVELGLVVGSEVKDLDPDEALDAVAGVTVCTSIAAHDEVPGLMGYKMFRGFLPCGPSVTPLARVNSDRLELGLQHDGEVVDVRSTESLRFTVAELVSYASRVMTLAPGDLITTGTPTRGSPKLKDGSEIEAWIDEIGRIRMDIEHAGAA